MPTARRSDARSRSDHSADWNPAQHAVHRLIQIVDVLGIAFNRFRQLSFKLPDPNSPDFSSERTQAETQRLWAEFGEIRHAVFPKEDIAPQHTVARLADSAVAELARLGATDHTPVQQAAQWIAAVGWLFTPRAYPKDPASPLHRVFDKEGALLDQYSTVRRGLIASLASVGQTIPAEIDRRQNLAFISLSHEGEEPTSQQTLLEWVRETTPQIGANASRNVQAGFRRILGNSIPVASDVLELGKNLRDANLFHFVKDNLPQDTDPARYAANLLYAATRYHQLENDKETRERVRDDLFICDKIADIQRLSLWGAVRDELIKFLKIIIAELEKRRPPNVCPKCGVELWPEEFGGVCPNCDLVAEPNPYEEAENALLEWAKIPVVKGKFHPSCWYWLEQCDQRGLASGEPNVWLPIILGYWGRLAPGKHLNEENLIAYLFSSHDMQPPQALTMNLSDLAQLLKSASTPKQVESPRPPAPPPTQRDKKLEERDEWVYRECCKGTPHDQIVAELKRKAIRRKWRIFSSKQRVQQIGIKYAEDHGLEPPPPRREN